MTNRAANKDLLDHLAGYIAHHKGMPVLIGVGLVIAGLGLNVVPGLGESAGFWGWLIQHDVLLYVGVIAGLLGILLGDAL
jgi:hypothetical protein